MIKNPSELRKSYNKLINNASKRHPPDKINKLRIPAVENMTDKINPTQLARINTAFERKLRHRHAMDLMKRYANLKALYMRKHPKEYKSKYAKMFKISCLIEGTKENADLIKGKIDTTRLNLILNMLSTIELCLCKDKDMPIRIR